MGVLGVVLEELGVELDELCKAGVATIAILWGLCTGPRDGVATAGPSPSRLSPPNPYSAAEASSPAERGEFNGVSFAGFFFFFFFFYFFFF